MSGMTKWQRQIAIASLGGACARCGENDGRLCISLSPYKRRGPTTYKSVMEESYPYKLLCRKCFHGASKHIERMGI